MGADLMSNSYTRPDSINEGQPRYVRCPACHGTGIDPTSHKSHQDDEWDCVECGGYGDLEIWDD